ncbi:MAG: smrA [Gammaproteobacteria bacterium]|jgi:DNA-nicking Smr family endonuclease|nr:smrA [Gammaproteobacteria bacterium]
MRGKQYTIEASLDLHGMVVTEARNALSHFLMECHRQGIRQVLIIHGKGRTNLYPILKNKLNQWLRQTDHVLAFCSVKTSDGSSGALHVLLKKARGCP